VILGQGDQIGQIFHFKLLEIAHILGLFFPSLELALIVTKNRLGYSLGDFFTNSSGHPVPTGHKALFFSIEFPTIS
jgi:hypothetical protein